MEVDGMPYSTLMLMFIFVALGLLQVGIAVPLALRRVKRNYVYGVRLPKTLRDDAIWYDANEYGGWQLLWSGTASVVLTVIAYFVPDLSANQALYSYVCIAIYIAPLSIGLSKTLKYVAKL